MRHGMSRCGFAVLLLSAAVMSGCSGTTGRPRAVPVSGVLTLDGTPVADARVRFVPTAEGGRTAIGDTDAAGQFTLSTFEPGDGVIPGEYDADISVNTPSSKALDTADMASKIESMEPPDGAVPEKFQDAKTSGLHYTFTDQDSGRVVDVKLTK